MIESEVGKNVLKTREFSITYRYDNKKKTFGSIAADKKKFIEHKTKELGIASNATTEKLLKVTTAAEFDEVAASFKDESYVDGFKI